MSLARSAALAGALGLLAAGCGGAAASGSAPTSTAVRLPGPEPKAPDTGAGLEEGIARALDTIAATDPRFAARMRVPPSEKAVRAAMVKALAEGDADISTREDELDFFAFTARGRSLEAAEKIVEALPIPPRNRGEGRLDGERLDRSLAVGLVAEERARLEEERTLPRGASALVRGIVDTWSPAPASREEAKARSEWVGKRLDVIRASLSSGGLSRSGVLGLDDALDPLERLATPDEMPEAARAIAALRLALDALRPLPTTGSDDERQQRVLAGVAAHVGIKVTFPSLVGDLRSAEEITRKLAKEAVARVDERQARRAAEAIDPWTGPCEMSYSGPPSPLVRIRSLAPPPERAPLCRLFHALHDAGDDLARAAVLVAFHDAAVVALWSVALHGSGATFEGAVATAHPFFGAQPDREARLVRIAEAAPNAAISVALAARFLDDALSPETAARWLALGDAPVAVAARKLAQDLEESSASPAPASPRP
jgi:hypothetical protein